MLVQRKVVGAQERPVLGLFVHGDEQLVDVVDDLVQVCLGKLVDGRIEQVHEAALGKGGRLADAVTLGARALLLQKVGRDKRKRLGAVGRAAQVNVVLVLVLHRLEALGHEGRRVQDADGHFRKVFLLSTPH